MLPIQFQVNLPFGLGEELKNVVVFFFKCRHGSHLGFQIENVYLFFIYKSFPMLLIKFQVNWSFDSGEEVKTKFLRWPRTSDRNDYSFFDL